LSTTNEKVPHDRSELIMNDLLRHGRVSIEDLAQRLNVSGISIRRDLRRLERAGLLRRDHGGAVPVRPVQYDAFRHDSSFREQIERFAEEKRRIGLAAVDLIGDGEVIALATGTTTTEVARAIPGRRAVTVLTNSVSVSLELSNRSDITVHLTGGVLRGSWFSLVGPAAIQNIQQMVVDALFIGVSGLSPERGVTDYHGEEAAVTRAMIDHTKKLIVVADHSKFGQVATHVVCPIERVHLIITDSGATDAQIVPFTARGVEVRRV
jgi:DeoR family transcriptional regulator of aga operon